nr:hypothetical protein [Paenibacillus tianmuensis]
MPLGPKDRKVQQALKGHKVQLVQLVQLAFKDRKVQRALKGHKVQLV